MRYIGYIAAALVALLLLVILSIAFGWFSGEASLRSFQSYKQTYQEAFDDVNAMEANVQQACVAQQALDAANKSGDQNTINQRTTQLLAIKDNYLRIGGEYDAYMEDHFRGGVNHPDLPIPYPALAERLATECS